jgi:hypothetical protein
MAALIIGVIVAGLGIGALVSAFQNRATLPELGATSIPMVTPVPQPTGPSPVVTLAPTPAPTPSPVPSVTASPSPAPLPSRSASPAPTPTPTATAIPSAAPVPSAAPAGGTPAPAATLKPLVVVLPTAKPVLPPPAVAVDPALAVVRRYISDLIAGDETGAYAALGGTSSDRTLDLKEEAFLDKDARITSMRVSHADAAGSTVDAEITSGRGSYVATFHVTNGPQGSTINQHDYIKI